MPLCNTKVVCRGLSIRFLYCFCRPSIWCRPGSTFCKRGWAERPSLWYLELMNVRASMIVIHLLACRLIILAQVQLLNSHFWLCVRVDGADWPRSFSPWQVVTGTMSRRWFRPMTLWIWCQVFGSTHQQDVQIWIIYMLFIWRVRGRSGSDLLKLCCVCLAVKIMTKLIVISYWTCGRNSRSFWIIEKFLTLQCMIKRQHTHTRMHNKNWRNHEKSRFLIVGDGRAIG